MVHECCTPRLWVLLWSMDVAHRACGCFCGPWMLHNALVGASVVHGCCTPRLWVCLWSVDVAHRACGCVCGSWMLHFALVGVSVVQGCCTPRLWVCLWSMDVAHRACGCACGPMDVAHRACGCVCGPSLYPILHAWLDDSLVMAVIPTNKRIFHVAASFYSLDKYGAGNTCTFVVKKYFDPAISWACSNAVFAASQLHLGSSQGLYEGWNFNSGNYLFTTDIK